MLLDVESVGLSFRIDADTDGDLEDGEDHEREDEGECSDGERPDELGNQVHFDTFELEER